MPDAAPVTSATLPTNQFAIGVFLSCSTLLYKTTPATVIRLGRSSHAIVYCLRESLERMAHTVCKPLPVKFLRRILGKRTRSRAPYEYGLLSQDGNKSTLFSLKRYHMVVPTVKTMGSEAGRLNGPVSLLGSLSKFCKNVTFLVQ